MNWLSHVWLDKLMSTHEYHFTNVQLEINFYLIFKNYILKILFGFMQEILNFIKD